MEKLVDGGYGGHQSRVSHSKDDENKKRHKFSLTLMKVSEKYVTFVS